MQLIFSLISCHLWYKGSRRNKLSVIGRGREQQELNPRPEDPQLLLVSFIYEK